MSSLALETGRGGGGSSGCVTVQVLESLNPSGGATMPLCKRIPLADWGGFSHLL